ncbi:MAG: DUF3570 domain-containing protein [Deltaproteobacteria bacterium]|nr:DUF3570 domain-containing protein [Deltaproteobacteria bacterium]
MSSRFRATALLAACLAFITPAAAWSDELGSLIRIFADTENNYILTGAVDYTKGLNGRYSVTARALVDGISSASTKVGNTVEDAYVGGFSNRQRGRFEISQPNWIRTRRELSAFGRALVGENDAAAGYIYSHESVYESHTAFASYRRYLAHRNASIAATWYHNFDKVMTDDNERKAELDLPGRKDTDGGSLALQQILSRKMVATVAAMARVERGALESPERDVILRSPPAAKTVGAEKLPENRARAAGSITVTRYLRKRMSLRADYQYGWDEWGCDGQSGTAAWFFGVGKRTMLRARARYYRQLASPYSTVAADPEVDDDYSRERGAPGISIVVGRSPAGLSRGRSPRRRDARLGRHRLRLLLPDAAQRAGGRLSGPHRGRQCALPVLERFANLRISSTMTRQVRSTVFSRRLTAFSSVAAASVRGGGRLSTLNCELSTGRHR